MKPLIAILLFATLKLEAQNMYIKEWKPSELIDSSTLVAVVERMGAIHESNVAIVPGSPIGTLMELRVLRVLDGDIGNEKTILVFTPPGDIHGGEFFLASKFILFLRPITQEQRVLLSKLNKTNMPGVNKRFSELKDNDVAWTLAASIEQWMGYYPIEVKPGKRIFSRLKRDLERLGVESAEDATGYLTKLIKLRRHPESATPDLANTEDPFVRSVLSSPRGKSIPSNH